MGHSQPEQASLASRLQAPSAPLLLPPPTLPQTLWSWPSRTCYPQNRAWSKGRMHSERTQAAAPRGLNMQDYTLSKTNEPLCEMLKQDK